MNSQHIATIGFAIISLVLLAFATLVLWKLFSDKKSLAGLISEPAAPNQPAGEAKASLSRFQFLIFTFVISGLYLLLSIEAGTFVDVPNNVLALLGISGGSYLVSKAMGPKTGGDTTSGSGTTGAVRT